MGREIAGPSPGSLVSIRVSLRDDAGLRIGPSPVMGRYDDETTIERLVACGGARAGRLAGGRRCGARGRRDRHLEVDRRARRELLRDDLEAETGRGETDGDDERSSGQRDRD